MLTNYTLFVSDCDETFHSTPGFKNGSVASPNFPNQYTKNLACIYRFIGLPNERVRLEFTDFDVDGVPPRSV